MTPEELAERRLLIVDNLELVEAAAACPDCASTATVRVENDGGVTVDIRHSTQTCPSSVDSGRWRRWHGYEEPTGGSDGPQT